MSVSQNFVCANCVYIFMLPGKLIEQPFFKKCRACIYVYIALSSMFLLSAGEIRVSLCPSLHSQTAPHHSEAVTKGLHCGPQR